MISAADFIEAGIPVPVNDSMSALRATAALEWMQENTTLKISTEDPATIAALPASAKVFVCKYSEILAARSGVTSQSIEGLSQSFDTTDRATLIWQLANTMLGGHLKSQVRVVPAKRRW
jgi:TusA-related sulfurtransferase